MQVLTNDETRQWCAERGLAFDQLPHWSDTRLKNGVQYVTKSKETVVAAWVRNSLDSASYDEGVVWITDWPLYAPDEMAVITRFRASVGERRALIDAPGHAYGPDEANDCIGCFSLCVHYHWDALLFVPASGLIIFNSHDGFQCASSTSGEARASLRSEVDRYDLKLLTL